MADFLGGEGAGLYYIILIGFGRLYFRTSFLNNPLSVYTTFIIIKFGSSTLARSEMEFF